MWTDRSIKAKLSGHHATPETWRLKGPLSSLIRRRKFINPELQRLDHPKLNQAERYYLAFTLQDLEDQKRAAKASIHALFEFWKEGVSAIRDLPIEQEVGKIKERISVPCRQQIETLKEKAVQWKEFCLSKNLPEVLEEINMPLPEEMRLFDTEDRKFHKKLPLRAQKKLEKKRKAYIEISINQPECTKVFHNVGVYSEINAAIFPTLISAVVPSMKRSMKMSQTKLSLKHERFMKKWTLGFNQAVDNLKSKIHDFADRLAFDPGKNKGFFKDFSVHLNSITTHSDAKELISGAAADMENTFKERREEMQRQIKNSIQHLGALSDVKTSRSVMRRNQETEIRLANAQDVIDENLEDISIDLDFWKEGAWDIIKTDINLAEIKTISFKCWLQSRVNLVDRSVSYSLDMFKSSAIDLLNANMSYNLNRYYFHMHPEEREFYVEGKRPFRSDWYEKCKIRTNWSDMWLIKEYIDEKFVDFEKRMKKLYKKELKLYDSNLATLKEEEAQLLRERTKHLNDAFNGAESLKQDMLAYVDLRFEDIYDKVARKLHGEMF